MQAAPRDAGFGLLEQIIAMTMIVGVLLGLLTTLGASAQGLKTSRQRTIAVSLSKQVIENLQGAAWADVATGTGVTTADTSGKVTAGPPMMFDGEDLFFGGATSYQTDHVAVGTTFSLRTFVTSVTPEGGGTGYRHVTVIVEWPSSSSTPHTMQFSSLVFQLDYTSYPASNGSAEVAGGFVTLNGCLGGDTFDDVHVALPGARADTIASTLRTAIGASTSAAGHVETHPRVDASPCVPVESVTTDNCPTVSIANIADNDSSTSTPNSSSGTGGYFFCPTLTTGGGLAVVVPPSGATSLTSHAKTDVCSPSCPFAGGLDVVPFADAMVTSTPGSSASSNNGGPSIGLWAFDDGWSATASVDHDTSGTVRTSATLSAPSLKILSFPQIPDGAVRVGGFTATASAAAGYSTIAPTLSFGTTVQYWTGTGYSAAMIVPETDWSGVAAFQVGGRQVSFDLTVQTQPLLVVTVEVTIETDTFTIEVNYGRVAVNSAWLSKAA